MTSPTKRRRTDSGRPSKTVRFADTPAQERTFNIYQDCQTEEDRQKVREIVWYTRRDFDDFLLDRVQTIRVWRSVGGDMHELHDHYCLRGLEPYQSSALNAEMHAQRNLYTRSILSEQRRMRTSTTSTSLVVGGGEADASSSYDPFATASHVSHISHWAMQQARRLALLDEEEANRIQHEASVHKLSSVQLPSSSSSRRRRSSASRRFSTTCLPAATTQTSSNSSGILPPLLSSTPQLSLDTATNVLAAPRANVDINLLKEMNLQFLQQVMANRDDQLLHKQHQLLLSNNNNNLPKAATANSNSMSLNSLLWSSSRNNHGAHRTVTQPHQNRLATGSTNNLTIPGSLRRHSLHLNPAEQNESNMPQPFLLIRRDSLHGLMPHHHHQHNPTREVACVGEKLPPHSGVCPTTS